MVSVPSRPSLLLHSCCGPCATVALERLLPRYAVTALWYNPNVEPAEEHLRRLQGMRRVATHFVVELVELEPDTIAWLSAVADLAQEPEGGRRCEVCFLFRLRRTAQMAADGGYQYFATTLTTGPQKRLEQIRQAGHIAAAEYGVQFLDESFRARAGFQRSVELSKELSLYRQNYCGCRYSMR